MLAKKWWIVVGIVVVALGLGLGLGLGLRGGPVKQVPAPGEWSALTDSEGFVFTFTINPDSTGITEIAFHFSDWTCGGVTSSGTVTNTPGPGNPWPVTDGQLSITASAGLTLQITIHGEFDETGTHASGTWEADSICSGTWEASPAS